MFREFFSRVGDVLTSLGAVVPKAVAFALGVVEAATAAIVGAIKYAGDRAVKLIATVKTALATLAAYLDRAFTE